MSIRTWQLLYVGDNHIFMKMELYQHKGLYGEFNEIYQVCAWRERKVFKDHIIPTVRKWTFEKLTLIIYPSACL